MAETLRAVISGLCPGVQFLAPETATYLVKVHRLRVGESFLALDPAAGLEADGQLLEPENGRMRCRIGALRAGRNVGFSRLTLVYALSKGDRVDRVIRDSVALGVGRVVLFEAARSVVKRASLGTNKLARWRSIAEQAARQCGRSDLPHLGVVTDWLAPFGAESHTRYSERKEGKPAQTNLVFHPSVESVGLGQALVGSPGAQELSLWVGPEGGFSASELAALEQRGAKMVSLGRFVLRTECAATVAVAIAAQWLNGG